MPKFTISAAFAAAAFALAGCGGGDGGDNEAVNEQSPGAQATEQAIPEDQEVTIALDQQGESGQSGTATITSEGPKTRIVIELEGGGEAGQPAHIHPGTCENLTPEPRFPLEDVAGGRSETVLEAPINEFLEGDFSINVHKSAAEADVYVACGAIVQS